MNATHSKKILLFTLILGSLLPVRSSVHAQLIPFGMLNKRAVPAAVTTLATAVGTSGQVDLTWTGVSGATSYDLYWRTTTGVTSANGTLIAGVTSPYAHTGRTNGQTYYYIIVAKNASGSSPDSAQVSATPNSNTGPTPDPMTFSVAPAGASTSSITMTATSATDADGVQYYFDVTSNSPDGADSGWRAATAWTVTGLWVNTLYTFTVKARDAVASPTETAASGSTTAYTLAAIPDVPLATSPTVSTVTLSVNPGSNPTSTGAWTGAQNTEFAVLCVTPCGNKYVNPAAASNPGSWGVSEVWGTYSTFGSASGLALSGFSGATLYEFQVKARNGSGTETSLSPVGKGNVPLSGTFTLKKGDGLKWIYTSGDLVFLPASPNTIRGYTNAVDITSDAGFNSSASDGVFRSDDLTTKNDIYAHMAEFNVSTFASITAATGRLVGYAALSGNYCPEIYRYANGVGWTAGTCNAATSSATVTVTVSSSLSDYVGANTMAVAAFVTTGAGGSYPKAGALKTDWIELDVTGVRDTTGPSSASSFVASPSGISGSVNLSWVLPKEEDFSASAPYGTIVLLRKTGGYAANADDTLATRVLGKNVTGGNQNYIATSTTDSGLVDGTPYYYSLYVADKYGNWSTAAQATATPSNSAPPEVSNLSAAAVSNKIMLIWTNPTVSDFAYVRILRKSTNDFGAYNDGSATVVLSDLNVISKYDSPPAYGTVYYYKIFTSDGINWSSGVATSGMANNGASSAAPSLDALANRTINAGMSMTPIDAGNEGGDDYDADGDALTYSCYFDTTVNGTVASTTACSSANLANGSGFAFDTATGVISGWQPVSGGNYEFKIVACDGSAEPCASMIFAVNIDLNPCLSLAGGTWIRVPGSSIYGTADFCVQKYLPSNVSSSPVAQVGTVPWNNITQAAAVTACSSLGVGYHLITNPEWMTIAANAANHGTNWSTGVVGSGYLNQGHTSTSPASSCGTDADDSKAWVETTCTPKTQGTTLWERRRTHYLSNGEVIWDMGGNRRTIIDYYNLNDKPYSFDGLVSYSITSIGSTTTPRSHLVPLNSVQSWWDDTWDMDQKVGYLYPGLNGVGGMMLRGGVTNSSSASGLFHAKMLEDPTVASTSNSFRCAYNL